MERPAPDSAELLERLRLRRDAPPPARARGGLLITAVALAAVGAGAWLVARSGRGPLVQTAVARAATEAPGGASVLDASGYVTARREATVSAKITGKVVEVLIEEGMRVEEGAVLARLDATEAEAQLALARAQLAAAHTAVAEMQAQLVQAERDYDRQLALAKEHITTVSALDAALALRDAFRAKLANAREQVTVADRSVSVAQVQLDNTEIRAPFAGVVIAKAAQPGEMISPVSAGGGFTRTGIGTIVDMDSLEIQVDVNEAFINRVTAGQPVEATLNAYPDWKIPGAVIAIIPTADRSKATVKVRIAIKDKDPRIVPDMGVRVAFLGPSTPDAGVAPAAAGVLVPSAAVRVEGDGGVVFVVADGKVERRRVTLGRSAGGHAEILAGVRTGERVVLSPPASLADGETVRLAETG